MNHTPIRNRIKSCNCQFCSFEQKLVVYTEIYEIITIYYRSPYEYVQIAGSRYIGILEKILHAFTTLTILTIKFNLTLRISFGLIIFSILLKLCIARIAKKSASYSAAKHKNRIDELIWDIFCFVSLSILSDKATNPTQWDNHDMAKRRQPHRRPKRNANHFSRNKKLPPRTTSCHRCGPSFLSDQVSKVTK